MELDKQQLIKRIINDVADLVNIQDENKRNAKVNQLLPLTLEDAVDSLLIAFSKSINSGNLQKTDVIKIVQEHMTKLLPEKYPTAEALANRLGWLKGMNMEDMEMPLSENHQIVEETFDQINKLLGNKFDYYHTGGLMGYLASGKPLERYHGDLDFFINENQLLTLKNLVDNNPNFKMISSLETKENNGHEFSILYKDSPIEIGLFLFDRSNNDEIILKSYYQDEKSKGNLVCDETHLSKEYSDLAFPKNNYKSHNNIPYSVQSLEAIYSSKNTSTRMKDKHDANVIENDVDKKIVEQMLQENTKTTKLKNIPANKSIVAHLGNLISEDANEKE